MSNWAEHIKQVWVDRKLDEYRANREDRKPQRIQDLPGYQPLNLRNEEDRLRVPQSVLDAYDFYVNSVEAGDYGSAWAFKEIFQDLDTYVVEVGTDGSDGWLEVFDQDGQSIGAARTSQERLAWGETSTIRSYTQNGGFPIELRIRRTHNDCFSDEQEAKVSECFDKWKQICFSAEGIEHQATSEAVKAAYKIAGLVEPELVFFDSPYAAYKPIIDEVRTEIRGASNDQFSKQLTAKLDNHLSSSWSIQLLQQLSNSLEEQVTAQVDEKLKREISAALNDRLWAEQSELLMQIIESKFAKAIWDDFQAVGVPWVSAFSAVRKQMRRCTIRREVLCRRVASLDVYISVLGCSHDANRWSTLQALARSCGWLTPYEQHCIVSSFPIKFLFDREGALHGTEEPAIQCTDGFSVYADHGRIARVVVDTV
jgi:hypothetical protein